MPISKNKTKSSSLTRFAWLSIAIAVFTIGVKTAAYFLTGSVGLLSDALESIVNLLGALMALGMLIIAARPADEEHTYGHTKAEYFSSGVEGTLILIAAISIAYTAVERLINPKPLEQVGLGLAVSVVASIANLIVSLILRKAGKQYNSISLTSNSRHLMTDVWTSGGVLVGVGLVAITKWQPLDSIVAMLVAANIVVTGFSIIQKSVRGLMDTSLEPEDIRLIEEVLQAYKTPGVIIHDLRTRQSGSAKFISLHVIVPGDWSVTKGHTLVTSIEKKLGEKITNSHVFTHLESSDGSDSIKKVTLTSQE
jgi:cation diffusion facilitator family transporter